MKTTDKTRLKVLIADDCAETRELIKNCFSKDDQICIVGEAGDGLEACEMIRKLQPDVLLLDMVMPRAGGMYVLEQLKDDSNALSCPHVIIVSAVGTEKVVVEAMKKGAEYYVMKPFSVEELLNYVKGTAAREKYWAI